MMKMIGPLGGMTWHSTAEYYRLINAGVQERLAGNHRLPLFDTTALHAAAAIEPAL